MTIGERTLLLTNRKVFLTGNFRGDSKAYPEIDGGVTYSWLHCVTGGFLFFGKGYQGML